MSSPGPGGARSLLDISVNTVVKATYGNIYMVCVTTAGTTAGAVYDSATTGAEAATNLVGAIPNVVGNYQFDGFPCMNGIAINPGSGQVLSVSYI